MRSSGRNHLYKVKRGCMAALRAPAQTARPIRAGNAFARPAIHPFAPAYTASTIRSSTPHKIADFVVKSASQCGNSADIRARFLDCMQIEVIGNQFGYVFGKEVNVIGNRDCCTACRTKA